MTKKILIIEDDVDINELIKMQLMEDGYTVINAFDGNEGMQKLDNEIPNLILLDIILPKINGFELCKKIKGNPLWSNIPIILMTATSGLDNVARNEDDVRADACISKPFDYSELLKTIKTFI